MKDRVTKMLTRSQPHDDQDSQIIQKNSRALYSNPTLNRNADINSISIAIQCVKFKSRIILRQNS